MMGMPAVTSDGPPYKRKQANRFLKLKGSPSTEWALSEGVPWTTDAHPKLPASFRAQARTLLLCFQHVPILREAGSSLAQEVMPFLWEAERQQALASCAKCGRGEACTGSTHRKCSRCKRVYYCSTACQKSHWKEHKKVCAAARR